jgi:hypothetical protein
MTPMTDLEAQQYFAEHPPTQVPIMTPVQKALIEARKALVCATRKIDEALGRGGQ